MSKLEPNELSIHGFDLQRPTYRNCQRPRSLRKERAIEGVTITDGYNQVGYTLFLSDGLILLNYWDTKKQQNVQLMEGTVKTHEDFEKLLKTADEQIRKYQLHSA